MKRKAMLIIAISICMLLISGCGGDDVSKVIDVEIEDETFIATVDQINSNFDEYVGKIVRFEGVFEKYGENPVFRQVIRIDGTC